MPGGEQRGDDGHAAPHTSGPGLPRTGGQGLQPLAHDDARRWQRHASVADREKRGDRHKQHRHRARKQIPLRPDHRLETRAPEPELAVGGEPGVRVGAVLHHGGERARGLSEATHLHVGVEERERESDAYRGGDRRAEPCARVAQAMAQPRLRRDVRRQPERGVHEEVPVGEVLRRQGETGEHGVAPAAPLPPLVQSPQHEREPLRREDLQVWPLVHAIQRESVEQSRDDCRPAIAREAAHEQIRAECRQDERREEQQVIGQQNVTCQRVHGRALHGLRHEQFRLAERVRRRMEDVGVPPVRQRRDVAVQHAARLVEVPREDPRVEERIAEVPRDVARQPRREGPRPRDRDEDEEERGAERAGACRAGDACAPRARHAVRPARNSPVYSATRS